MFSSVQSSRSVLSGSATPWTAAHQTSLSITISWSFSKHISIELVMPSSHLILCCPLLLPSIFPCIRVFSLFFCCCSLFVSLINVFILHYHIVFVLPYIDLNLPWVYRDFSNESVFRTRWPIHLSVFV